MPCHSLYSIAVVDKQIRWLPQQTSKKSAGPCAAAPAARRPLAGRACGPAAARRPRSRAVLWRAAQLERQLRQHALQQDAPAAAARGSLRRAEPRRPVPPASGSPSCCRAACGMCMHCGLVWKEHIQSIARRVHRSRHTHRDRASKRGCLQQSLPRVRPVCRLSRAATLGMTLAQGVYWRHECAEQALQESAEPALLLTRA